MILSVAALLASFPLLKGLTFDPKKDDTYQFPLSGDSSVRTLDTHSGLANANGDSFVLDGSDLVYRVSSLWTFLTLEDGTDYQIWGYIPVTYGAQADLNCSDSQCGAKPNCDLELSNSSILWFSGCNYCAYAQENPTPNEQGKSHRIKSSSSFLLTNYGGINLETGKLSNDTAIPGYTLSQNTDDIQRHAFIADITAVPDFSLQDLCYTTGDAINVPNLLSCSDLEKEQNFVPTAKIYVPQIDRPTVLEALNQMTLVQATSDSEDQEENQEENDSNSDNTGSNVFDAISAYINISSSNITTKDCEDKNATLSPSLTPTAMPFSWYIIQTPNTHPNQTLPTLKGQKILTDKGLEAWDDSSSSFLDPKNKMFLTLSADSTITSVPNQTVTWELGEALDQPYAYYLLIQNPNFENVLSVFKFFNGTSGFAADTLDDSVPTLISNTIYSTYLLTIMDFGPIALDAVNIPCGIELQSSDTDLDMIVTVKAPTTCSIDLQPNQSPKQLTFTADKLQWKLSLNIPDDLPLNSEVSCQCDGSSKYSTQVPQIYTKEDNGIETDPTKSSATDHSSRNGNSSPTSLSWWNKISRIFDGMGSNIMKILSYLWSRFPFLFWIIWILLGLVIIGAILNHFGLLKKYLPKSLGEYSKVANLEDETEELEEEE